MIGWPWRKLPGMGDIDAAIDRLDAALVAAGFEGLAPPKSDAAFEEIAEAVRPYALPKDLVRFWDRVDPERIGVTLFPALVGPSSALELYRLNRDADLFPLAGPPLLFPIAYSSHVHRSIELVSEWSDGGAIFTWAWGDDGFRLGYRSLSELVDTCAALVAEGALERRGGFAFVPIEAEEGKQSARLEMAPPHALYGDAREIAAEVDAWPAHWLESSGIDVRNREPLGATHTIAALVDAAEHGPVRGRIAGTVTRVVGFGGDTLVLVDDGTRPLDVWCPAGTSPWGPVHRARFEFEVTLQGPVPPPPDFDRIHGELQQNAVAGRLEDAQAAAGELFGRLERHRPAAVASAVRPLD